MIRQPSPRELTLREAADLCRMAPDTVRGWVKSGQLHARKVGPQKQYRISPDDLQKFLDQR